MKWLIVLCLYFCVVTCSPSFGQPNEVRISGFIIAKESGEKLPGALIFDKDRKMASVANGYGFYSIAVPPGRVTLHVSFIGYKTLVFSENVSEDWSFNFELAPQLRELDEVVVSAERDDFISSAEMGAYKLQMEALKSIPSIGGEPDILRGLQFIPGVQSSYEGTTNLSIRGGSFDQNLFLLDDAPIYNPSHALSFFSVFNTDAIKSVKLFRSAIPAQYGGKLSSVVDVSMKEGNNKHLKVSGGVGLIASRLTLESPIVKDKSSFMLSGRYSYAGQLINGFYGLGQLFGAFNNVSTNNEVRFYDVNAKTNFIVNSKNHLYFSAYSGQDHFYYAAIDDASSMDWGNSLGNLRWNHVYGTRLFSNTMLLYSQYHYQYYLKDDAMAYKWSASMNEIDIKSDFDFYANARNYLKFGVSAESHTYFPGKIEPRTSESIATPIELGHKRALIAAAYVNNDYQLSERFKINYGVRYATFFLLGGGASDNLSSADSVFYNNGELSKFYQGLEPRFSTVFQLDKGKSIKASYNRTKQYQHLLSNSGVGLPTDIWIPADANIRPQSADQMSLGYYFSTGSKLYEFSSEVYYKKMNHVIDFRDNADLFLNTQLATQILSGSGTSYGIEFFFEKKAGKLTGWVSYTLSKALRNIEGINSGADYPAIFDKRHNLAIVANYKLNNRMTLSSNFKLTSGGRATLPEGTFRYYGASFNYYTQRNGYQLPAYHRLDVALQLESKKNNERRWKGEWVFGIYNVYNRKNIFSLFIKQDQFNLSQSQAYKMYVYGTAPYVTYNFRF